MVFNPILAPRFHSFDDTVLHRNSCHFVFLAWCLSSGAQQCEHLAGGNDRGSFAGIYLLGNWPLCRSRPSASVLFHFAIWLVEMEALWQR